MDDALDKASLFACVKEPVCVGMHQSSVVSPNSISNTTTHLLIWRIVMWGDMSPGFEPVPRVCSLTWLNKCNRKNDEFENDIHKESCF